MDKGARLSLSRRGRTTAARTVAEALVGALEARAVKRIFGVPGGGSSLDIIAAIVAEDIDFVLTQTGTAATLTDIRNPRVIELHPNLAEVYRRKVAALEVAPNEDEDTRREAVPLLRSVIHRIVLQSGQKRGEMTVKVYGEPGAVLALASGDPTAASLRGIFRACAAFGHGRVPPGDFSRLRGLRPRSRKMVAEEGFRQYLPTLQIEV